MKQELVSGIANSRDEAKITLLRVPDQPGVAAKIFGPLSEAAVNVDMIVQNVSAETERTDLTFTVGKTELERAVAVLRSRQAELGFDELRSDPNVVKVSVIGVGLRSHAEIGSAHVRTTVT